MCLSVALTALMAAQFFLITCVLFETTAAISFLGGFLHTSLSISGEIPPTIGRLKKLAWI